MDTRQNILEANFRSIALNGFQGTRADKVIQELGITKGALYHYFPSKTELGYAVVEEILAPMYLGDWAELESCADPVEGLAQLLRKHVDRATDESIVLGCPLNTLTQEMSPLDEGFRLRLASIMESMVASARRSLAKARDKGLIRSDIDVHAEALFLVSALEGAYGLGKTLRSKTVFAQCMERLCAVIESYRVS